MKKLFFSAKILLIFVFCFLSSGLSAKNLYFVKLKIYKQELSLFNSKNERNAVILELPLDKDLFNSIQKGDVLQKNAVYKSSFSIFPKFFETFKIVVLQKKIVKQNDAPETSENKFYMLKLRSQKHETFSFNIKNSRNAIIFELPVDKDFFQKVRINETLCERDVYNGAFDIFPEMFSDIRVTVEDKRIKNK